MDPVNVAGSAKTLSQARETKYPPEAAVDPMLHITGFCETVLTCSISRRIASEEV